MDVSAVSGVAAGFEGARIAGQQQAAASASASATRKDNQQRAEEADVKQTDVVPENSEASSSGQTGQKRVNILV